ncbi:PTS sugar transporter subunit IIB [Arsenophonus symbiont of Ornithomya chloropus]|uniref:PTS sugar transporter subunit IIB n=1 Tax=Arsenophonus symbiont of Ornithomya chloropus TaxID=634121 RepID=UPI003D6D4D6F
MAPSNIIAPVVNIEKCIRVYNNVQYTNKKVMMLFTNLYNVLNIIKGGIKIKSLNIKFMSYKNSTR